MRPAHAGSCTSVTPQTTTVSLPAITVARDTPPGTILSSAKTGSAGVYGQGCTTPLTLSAEMQYSTSLSQFGNHVYDTNIPGVGIRFDQGEFYFDSPATIASENIGTNINYCCGTVQLVATGKIASGTLAPGPLGTISILGYDNIYWPGVTINLQSEVKVTALACTLNTPQLSFDLGSIAADSFGNSPGFTPDKTATKALQMVCDAGVNVNVTLSGTQSPDSGDNSILALSGQGGSSVAQGVGVQLLYAGTPLALNQTVNLKKTAGAGESESFDLTARYIQTQNTVKAGQANATAVLNITYQ